MIDYDSEDEQYLLETSNESTATYKIPIPNAIIECNIDIAQTDSKAHNSRDCDDEYEELCNQRQVTFKKEIESKMRMRKKKL